MLRSVGRYAYQSPEKQLTRHGGRRAVETISPLISIIIINHPSISKLLYEEEENEHVSLIILDTFSRGDVISSEALAVCPEACPCGSISVIARIYLYL